MVNFWANLENNLSVWIGMALLGVLTIT